jgi:hypothetical protein
VNGINTPDNNAPAKSRNEHSHPRRYRSIDDRTLQNSPSAFDRKHGIDMELGMHRWSNHRTTKLSDHRPTATLAEASDLRITETVATAKRGGGSLQRPC